MASRGQSNSTYGGRQEYQRPRRPSPDTVSYLRSLPLAEANEAEEEMAPFHSLENETVNATEKRVYAMEFPMCLAVALQAVEEVRFEFASLAGAEDSAPILEILVRRTAPFSEKACRVLWQSCEGYWMHLSRHRYGSHVLQTLLQCSVRMSSPVDLAQHPEAPDFASDLPSAPQNWISTCLTSAFEEMEAEITFLSTHMCGTHVLRSLILAMGGLENDPTSKFGKDGDKPRGKNKKKKSKKPENAETTSFSTPSSKIQLRHIPNNRIPSCERASLLELLQRLTDALTPNSESGNAPGTLQQLACDSSGGPLLMTLLRVWSCQQESTATTRGDKSASKATTSTNKTTNNRQVDHLQQSQSEEYFELNSPAHQLAKKLLCWNDSSPDDSSHMQQQETPSQAYAPDVIYGLAGEARGSHVLDTILRLAPDSWFNEIVKSGDFCTSRSFQDYASHEVSNFVIQAILDTQRSLEMARTLTVDCCIPLIQSGFLLKPEQRRRGILWRLVEMATRSPFQECQAPILESLKKGLQESGMKGNLQELPAYLLQVQLPNAENGENRLRLNVEGSRALYHLLQFRDSKPFLQGIKSLSIDELQAIAKDGLGSRVVWDGMTTSSSKAKGKALSQLVRKLEGRWTSVALDRVGNFVVQNVFWSMISMDVREEMIKEFSRSLSRLNGDSRGRSLVSAFCVYEYKSQGSEVWREIIGRELNQKREYTDFFDDDPPAKEKDLQQEPLLIDSSKKRSKQSPVDAIFDALSLPPKRRKT